MTNKLGDRHDVAELLHLPSDRSVETLYPLGIPVIRLSRRRPRFDLDEVLKWAKKRFGSAGVRPARNGRKRGGAK